MGLNFEKWHGNGNDFIIINSIEDELKITRNKIIKISDRNIGIGFDQLIKIDLPTKPNQDFFIRFFNADGSEAGMCLNGIRCAAKYIWNNSFAPIGTVNFQTKTKNIVCEPKARKMIQVHIEPPDKIEHKSLYNKLKNKGVNNFFISNIGNNHLCIKMKSIKKINLNEIYKNLEGVIRELDINLSIFKKDGSSIDIRTYENGVGETLSCGSAALCVASYFLKDKLLKIRSIGGELVFKKNKNGILMAGPASFIYRGNVSD